MQPHLARHRAEARRIGRGLVDAGDAELARAGAGGIGPQPDHAAHGQAFGRGQLAGNQDVRRSILRVNRGCRRQDEEREQERAEAHD